MADQSASGRACRPRTEDAVAASSGALLFSQSDVSSTMCAVQSSAELHAVAGKTFQHSSMAPSKISLLATAHRTHVHVSGSGPRTVCLDGHRTE